MKQVRRLCISRIGNDEYDMAGAVTGAYVEYADYFILESKLQALIDAAEIAASDLDGEGLCRDAERLEAAIAKAKE